MKIKKILIGILLLSVVASGLKYLDLCVSNKYEVQLEGLNPTQIQIKEANKLKKKIELDKKIAAFVIIVSLIIIFPVSLMKEKP